MKQISVIVPNYNSSTYITRCLDALINQDYKVSEIIVVDDCSTDESITIIEEYVKKYNNIVLHKNDKNKGVSYSRNRGIEIAKSEYIMFCDGDDWYEKDATKKLMDVVEKENADYVVAGYYITYNNEKKIPIKYADFLNEGIVDKATCVAYMPITSSAKLIKKDILVKHNLEYPEGIRNCEELPVIPTAAFWANKVIYINECIYNYYQRENSASNKKISDLSFFDIVYEKFKQNIPAGYEKQVIQRMAEHLLYSKTLVLLKNGMPRKEIIKHIEICKNELNGQDIKLVLRKFPIRKRLFLQCALRKFILPLRLYAILQQKVLKG